MIGYQMARLESDIMMDVLLRLKAQGIAGLPIHDGLLVEQGKVCEAQRIMADVTKRKTGVHHPKSGDFAQARQTGDTCHLWR